MRKRFIAAAILAALLCGLLPKQAFALERMDTIRVGLSRFKDANSVNLTDKRLRIGFDTGVGFGEMISLTSNVWFSLELPSGVYKRINSIYTDYASASAAVGTYKSAGLKANICLLYAGVYTVAFGPYASQTEGDAATAGLQSSTEDSAKIVVLMDGMNVAAVFYCLDSFPQFQNPDGSTSLGDRKYRGVIECGRYTGNKLTAVNVLSLEEYLYSAVPSEVPQSWPSEALAAQAVAARTFCYSRAGYHKADGFDVCDNTHCEMYLGTAQEGVNTTNAVGGTSGIIAVYNDSPITATFFASSGGFTEDSANVWTLDLPYLKSVPDTYETGAKQWSRSYSLNDIDTALAARNADIGKAAGITIDISPNGRVQKLTVNGTMSSLTITKEDIRTFFSSLPGGSLESRMFVVTNGTASGGLAQGVYASNGVTAVQAQPTGLFAVSASETAQVGQRPYAVSAFGQNLLGLTSAAAMSSAGNTINISGRGHGHGVGMSQEGARGMAEAGFNYEKILKYYYTGIQLMAVN